MKIGKNNYVVNWLKYVFEKRTTTDINWFKVIICRIKGHKSGPVWYNPNGLEPDMHCKNCGDDLG